MYFNTTFGIFNRTLSFTIQNGKIFSIRFLVTKTPGKETTGITSRCADGKHVLFFDFDGLTKEECEEEIHYLIGYYQLGNFILFENDMPNSFHGYCNDKFSLYDAIEIISNSSADKGFKRAPINYRRKRWVIRETTKGDRAKPKLVKIIDSEYQSNPKSTAHRLFLNANYGLKIPEQINEDNLKDFIGICEYKTASNC